MQEQEIWKDVVGYEGLYQVSNFGRVKSIRKNKVMILSYDRGLHYLDVILRKDGSIKHFSVHRLVAQTFIPNPNNLPQVNHIDENKTNNHADNLEWCDRNYNMQYGRKTRWHCMPVAQYTLDGIFIKCYDSIKEASNATGIHSTNIANCAHKRIVNKEKGHIVKSAGGFKWEFISLNLD